MPVPATEISDGKRAIMKTAAVLFARKGYSGVGTAELCAESGYGKGAFYHHIRSKEDLLLDIMTLYLHELLADAEAILARETGAEARITALSLSLMRAIVQDHDQMTVCFREVHALSPDRRRGILRLHGDYFRLWERMMNEARDAAQLRSIDADELKGILGMYFYSFLWVGPGREGDIEALAAKFAALVLRACRRD
ncbi:TetR/AcrR family transcriptional regulator [Mesobaculum littorinae]|uniref:TetR/AcrR family transcriptional regulator n=1 Tax=Mesobaculum littorinae TaxID=2486419 RepID=A0A438AEE1_9RHOB|nr:TetR/AcrR family transcriptional regulator [Mesobaculum littorinae]RVV97076.1 TetR/AcrR family transcriptional regulator [Mesobaculum littorinae]